MSRLGVSAASVFAAWALVSESGEPAKLGIPRDHLGSFLPLPERCDTPENPATNAKIALGRTLFFDLEPVAPNLGVELPLAGSFWEGEWWT